MILSEELVNAIKNEIYKHVANEIKDYFTISENGLSAMADHVKEHLQNINVSISHVNKHKELGIVFFAGPEGFDNRKSVSLEQLLSDEINDPDDDAEELTFILERLEAMAGRLRDHLANRQVDE